MLNLLKVGAMGLALALPLTVFSAHSSSAAAVCIDVGGSEYKLAKLPRSEKPKPIIVTLLSTPQIPALATGHTLANDTKIVGITEMWSGEGAHPIGTLRLWFAADGLSGFYQRTYSGNGAPADDDGAISFISCP